MDDRRAARRAAMPITSALLEEYAEFSPKVIYASKNSRLSHARLTQLLDYSPETGVFLWRDVPRRGQKHIGKPAGSPSGEGYLSIVIDRMRFGAHRLAWFYVHGVFPVGAIDHVNGNRCDNRIVNLREASPAMNMENKRRAHANNRLGVLGVRRHGDRFVARITVAGNQLHIGCFDTEDEAHEAYLDAKRRMHQGCAI